MQVNAEVELAVLLPAEDVAQVLDAGIEGRVSCEVGTRRLDAQRIGVTVFGDGGIVRVEWDAPVDPVVWDGGARHEVDSVGLANDGTNALGDGTHAGR